MTRQQFDRAVAEVMQTLPDAFKPFLNNLVIDVEDYPSRRLLRSLDYTDEEIDDGESLYGLFIPSEFDSGDGLGGVDEFDQPPHRIIIYQRPLEEDFADHDELLTEIRKTVIHELAHHFGWTDRDLEKFDDNPDPFRRNK